MFVSDLNHFLDLPQDAPGPSRKMAEQLLSIVRAATSAEEGVSWETALSCRRRPGNKQCEGHIGVVCPEDDGPIEWSCTVCDDEGIITGWEGSLLDLRRVRADTDRRLHDVVVSTEIWATLRGLSLLDSDCERLVYSAIPAGRSVVLEAEVDDLENLLEHVAAAANHEDDRRRQKRLDVAVDALERQFYEIDSRTKTSGRSTSLAPILPIKAKQPQRQTVRGLEGKWRIIEMDLWDQEDLDLVEPAFIEFEKGRHGNLGFIAVQGSLDWRSAVIEGNRAIDFTWHGFDEGDPVSGRGWAVSEPDVGMAGRIFFHLGDDSGFRAQRW